MTEKRMTYLGGFTPEDFLQETNDVLLGIGDVFTVCVLARCFPGFPTPIIAVLDNTGDIGAPTDGYGIACGLNGVGSVVWGNGAGQEILFVQQTVSVGPGASCLTVVRFDGPNDITELFINGCKLAEETGGGTGISAAASSTPTTVGTVPSGGAGNVANDANAGISGIAIADGLLTDQQIADHASAVFEDYSMADTGVWDALWDARSGIPAADADTTGWLDEISAAPLDRVVTTPTLASESGRPRFL